MSTKLLDKARDLRGAGAPPATDRVAPATDKLDHAVPATSPPVAPIAGALAAAELALPEPCHTCGAVPAAGQRWCLRCGAELAFAPARRWRPAAIVAGALLVLSAMAAAGYALTGPAPHDIIVPPAPPPRTVGYAPTVTVPAPVAPKLAPLAAPPAPAPIAPSAPVASHSTGQPKGAQAPSTPPSSGAAPLTDVAAQDVVQSFPPTIAPSLAPAHPEYAVDGDPITAWTTATYSDPSTAPDVGLWIDVGSRIGVRRIGLRTPTPGFTVFVYGAVTLPLGAAAPGSGPGAPGATTSPGAGSTPGTGSTASGSTGTPTSGTTTGTTPGTTTPGGTPGTPDALVGPGWTRVARIVSVRARGSSPLALAGRRFRYYLIFVTSLPPHGNHVAIAEIQLLAP